MKSIVKQNINFIILFFIILILVVLFEFLARDFLNETMYLPGTNILNVQKYLKSNSEIGFLWKKNIAYSDSILLPWSDQIVTPLSTDSNGFRNLPAAIFSQQSVDIIGLGDSFIHDASYIFYNYFDKKGLFYYNMAMHRHSPPQYNLILKEYAIKQKPKWIIYGIYENDFIESIDFINWKNSKMDWFRFHSGVWGGPETIDNLKEPYSIPLFKGSYAFFRLFYNKIKSKYFAKNKVDGVKIVSKCIREAFVISKKNNIKFLLLLIPSKETLYSGKSQNYDTLLNDIEDSGITVIDLRKYFSRCKNKDKLYYEIDGHWNEYGILEGAKIINSYIKNDKQNNCVKK